GSSSTVTCSVIAAATSLPMTARTSERSSIIWGTEGPSAAHRYSICPHTRPISTQSSYSLANSKHCCENPLSERYRTSGAEFGRSFVQFVHKDAPISSATQAMYQHEREMLRCSRT